MLNLLKKMGEDPAALLKAARERKIDRDVLAGKWKVTDGGAEAEWAFDRDAAVESSTGLHGL